MILETTRIDVSGMTCGGCVASVTRVLKAVPGVRDATVDLHAGIATVTYDAARTNVPALKAAIVEAGYGVTR